MGLKQSVFSVVIKLFPDLPKKLEMAGMHIDPTDFVAMTSSNAFVMMIILTFLAVVGASYYNFNLTPPLIIIIALAAFFIFFMMGIGALDARLRQKAKK